MTFSRAWGCAPVAVAHIRPGAHILRASSVSETFRRPCITIALTYQIVFGLTVLF